MSGIFQEAFIYHAMKIKQLKVDEGLNEKGGLKNNVFKSGASYREILGK